MFQGKAVKVVRIKRGFLGFGERRKHEQAVNRMAKKGYRYVDSSKKWGGYDLTFVKDQP